MIIQEILEENKDLIRTYSDEGRYVVNQKGDAYGEAIDLVKFIEDGTIVYTEGELMPKEQNLEE